MKVNVMKNCIKIIRAKYRLLVSKGIREKIYQIKTNIRFKYCINMNCDIPEKFRLRTKPSFYEKTANPEDIIVAHPHSIFISKNAEIGNSCLLSGANVIGYNNGAPKIGNNVIMGAGAVIIGNVVIGNNVRIGANATVSKSIPDNCIVIEFNKIINKDK